MNTTTTSRERGILFSAPMVRALLDGTKTQTRRAWKLPQWAHPDDAGDDLPHAVCHRSSGCLVDIPCPYGVVGDRLWVRETWGYRGGSAAWLGGDRRPYDEKLIEWRADGARKYIHRPVGDLAGIPKARPQRDDESTEDYCGVYLTRFWRQWRPAIHMSRWMSRLTLEIVDVRVQRLRDVGEDDAKAEGVTPFAHVGDDQRLTTGERFGDAPHVGAYGVLWDTINGAGAWAANPWVWALTFKRVDAVAAREAA